MFTHPHEIHTTLLYDGDPERNGYASGPERSLMLALLHDAIQNFLGPEASDGGSRQKEARDWINRPGAEYIFSFESVCEAVGIDAEALRSCLNSSRISKVNRRVF